MGCQQSAPVERKPITGVGQTERLVSRAERIKKQQSAKGKSSDKLPSPKLDTCGNLMPEEVVKRTNSSITCKEITLGTKDCPIKIEYAYWTQRGYYPEEVHKENQDEYSITPKFAGAELDAMFAVYDGHGRKGHSCARYAKKKLPQLVAKHIRQARVKKYLADLEKEGKEKGAKTFDPEKWPLLTPEEYKKACRKGFLECNKTMHTDVGVNDDMSGTTAITVHFHGNLVTICNVGDSRAVLGHLISDDNRDENSEEEKTEIGEEPQDRDSPQGELLLAIPLSRDQTPYRKDERERVKKLGASIMSIDQMEGLEEMHDNWGDMVLGEDVDIHGDPPRVWVKGKDYPGCAFTRSIGDSRAEDIGVTAEPEMLARELTSNDQILVIASDGIFEFMTNQEAIDICAACQNPIHACEQLVAAAYDKWLIYERRTDDITVIVCFLTCTRKPPADGTEGTTEDLVALAKSIYGNKPVRKRPRSEHDNLSISMYAADEAAKAVAKPVKPRKENGGEPIQKDRLERGNSLYENSKEESQGVES